MSMIKLLFLVAVLVRSCTVRWEVVPNEEKLIISYKPKCELQSPPSAFLNSANPIDVFETSIYEIRHGVSSTGHFKFSKFLKTPLSALSPEELHGSLLATAFSNLLSEKYYDMETLRARKVVSKFLPLLNIGIVDNSFETPGENFLFQGDLIFNSLSELPCIESIEFDEIRIPYCLEDNNNFVLSTNSSLPEEKGNTLRAMDPLFRQQWQLLSEESFSANFDAAWSIYRGAKSRKGPTVAVVDSGCSAHPDLFHNFWRNPNLNCSEPDVEATGACFGWDFGDSDSIPFDEPLDGVHGTNVAGLIAAEANNDFLATGGCWNCQIACLKVYSSKIGGFSLSAIVEANNFILENKIEISNHSYGGWGSGVAERRSVEALGKIKHIFVTAAGNEDCNLDAVLEEEKCKNMQGFPRRTIYTPASYEYDHVFTIGATDRYGNKADFSSWGPKTVDLFAPGKSLITITNTLAKMEGAAEVSGTSYASPLVAAAAGLLVGYNPELSAKEIIEIIKASGRPLDSLKGLSNTEKLLDVFAALQMASGESDASYPVERNPSPQMDFTPLFYPNDGEFPALGCLLLFLL